MLQRTIKIPALGDERSCPALTGGLPLAASDTANGLRRLSPGVQGLSSLNNGRHLVPTLCQVSSVKPLNYPLTTKCPKHDRGPEIYQELAQ